MNEITKRTCIYYTPHGTKHHVRLDLDYHTHIFHKVQEEHHQLLKKESQGIYCQTHYPIPLKKTKQNKRRSHGTTFNTLRFQEEQGYHPDELQRIPPFPEGL